MTNTFKVKHDLDVAGIAYASDIELDTFPQIPLTTKTVGSGKDFATLDLALDWYLQLRHSLVPGPGDTIRRALPGVVLDLDAGTHTLKAREYAGWNWEIFAIDEVHLQIKGKGSSGAGKTTITLAADFPTGQWTTLFNVSDGWFSLKDIEIDAYAGGFTDSEKTITCIFGHMATETWLYNVAIKNFFDGITVSGFAYFVNGVTISDCEYGVSSTTSSGTVIGGNSAVSITNCENAYWTETGGRTNLTTGTHTLSGNTIDYNIALNEVTPKGTIWDGTSDLIFPGTVLDTRPSSADVVKTVGTGKDFATLDAALEWYSKIIPIPGPTTIGIGPEVVDNERGSPHWVWLELDPGVHELKARTPLTSWWSIFAIQGVALTISGTTNTPADTIITFADDWAEDEWPYVFQVLGTRFEFRKALFDPYYNGWTDSGGDCVTFIVAEGGAHIYTRYAEIKNCYEGMVISNSAVHIEHTTISYNDNTGVWLGYDTSAQILFSTFSNNGTAIEVELNSSVKFEYNTLTSNTADFNVPLNTVTGNGYIWDGTSDLLLPSAVPITRTINGLPLSADITIDAQGGFASSYLFCEDVMFGGTSPVWHELESQSDGGTTGSHTVTTGSNTFVEMDRYVTAALNTTIVPGGNWSFVLYAKTDSYLREKILRAIIYRVDSAGAILGGAIGTATSAEFINEGVTGIPLHVYIAEQTGWAVTDRIGVVIQGKRVDGLGTLTFYHDVTSGWGSSMECPLTLLHNQMNGLNQGDYQHLTATEKTKATTVATTSAIGLAPILPNDATKFLNGTGSYTVPAAPSKSVSYTAVDATATENSHIEVTAASQTITLPSSPSTGSEVTIGVGNFEDTIVDRNSELIEGLSEDLTLDLANAVTTFRFLDGAYGWRIVS